MAVRDVWAPEVVVMMASGVMAGRPRQWTLIFRTLARTFGVALVRTIAVLSDRVTAIFFRSSSYDTCIYRSFTHDLFLLPQCGTCEGRTERFSIRPHMRLRTGFDFVQADPNVPLSQ